MIERRSGCSGAGSGRGEGAWAGDLGEPGRMILESGEFSKRQLMSSCTIVEANDRAERGIKQAI